jgi:curli biogenesis system outer membrane secretion channel CsgG
MVRKLAVILAFGVLALPAGAQQKKLVAVMNFEYATVQSQVAAVFGTNKDIGQGIADMLVNHLVNDGVYRVIERQQLDKVLAEQNFSNSDRADPASAAKIAKILGVQAIIVGSITQFGRDDKSTGVGGGGLGHYGGKFGIGGVGHKSSKAVVVVTARIINTDTAEIMASADGKGESSRSGTNLLGAGGSGGSAGGGGVDMNSSNFANTIIGEATAQAVADLATKLDQQAARLPDRVITIDGLVADATGGNLILNIGARAGVKMGDTYKVMREGRTIKDPTTGKVLRHVETQVGEVQITDVDDSSSGGKFTGSTPAKVGDRITR